MGVAHTAVGDGEVASYRLAAFPGSLPTGVLIDGEWRSVDATDCLDVLNPATEEVFGRVAIASADDVDAALAAAVESWQSWRKVDGWTRSQLLRRVAQILRQWQPRLADVLTAEQGKPLAESQSEVAAAIDQFDWYADEARRIYGRTIGGRSSDSRVVVTSEPIGPVAVFTSWNFPALLPARKMAAALAAGCSIIVKPAEDAPFSACLLAEACDRAGIPPGVVGVLTGSPKLISALLIGSGAIRKISLTGSVEVGAELLHAAAPRIVPAAMELGGHAPVLVFDDADADKAAAACVKGKFRNAGQVCASPSRFFVHERIVGRFTAAFVRETEQLVVGDGRDPATNVGPLSNRRRLEATEALIQDAVAKGAMVASGGKRSSQPVRGFFFQPTVLTDVPAECRVLQEEPFAPIAPIVSFSSLDEALRLANETPYGLASYVFTNSLETAWRASEGLEAGMVGVNTTAVAFAEAPFGGVKLSGFGREGGSEGIAEYLVTKYTNFAL
jgi:succinate-semialdehyde dehydrogenase / glutarate-semialdehyde dehydrogenase